MGQGIDVVRAYRGFDQPVGRFALTVVLPAVGGTLALALLLRLLAPSLATGPAGLVLLALPGIVLLVTLAYPVMVADSRRVEIDRNVHLFVTHMAVLATANLPRTQLLHHLSRKREYGALADEMRKLFTLVDSWHMSLSEAARLIAKETPSHILADFLDRFAYSLDSGENLEGFLKNEQVVVMKDFAAHYRGHLYELEGMKQLYSGMVMSLVFLVVFSLFVPILTGIPALYVFGASAVFTLLVEGAFVMLAKVRAPHDPVWYRTRVPTDVVRALTRSLPVSLLGALAATGLVLAFGRGLPPGIAIALAVTPLAYTGLRVAAEEKRIERRDRNFPAFIRSLGASVTSRGGNVVDALDHLRHHDFGPLTGNIRALHQRLSLRLDDEGGWDWFAAETGSHLVQNFTRIFMEGLKNGGRADLMGGILSDNAVHVLTLRKERGQLVTTLRSLLAGLVAGIGFSVFVGFGILALLQGVFDGVAQNVDTEEVLGGAFTARLDIPAVRVGMAFALLGHCVASALMLHHARGGHPHRLLFELVLFTWIAGLTGVLSEAAVAKLGVG